LQKSTGKEGEVKWVWDVSLSPNSKLVLLLTKPKTIKHFIFGN